MHGSGVEIRLKCTLEFLSLFNSSLVRFKSVLNYVIIRQPQRLEHSGGVYRRTRSIWSERINHSIRQVLNQRHLYGIEKKARHINAVGLTLNIVVANAKLRQCFKIHGC
jgi:hypothetical protein